MNAPARAEAAREIESLEQEKSRLEQDRSLEEYAHDPAYLEVEARLLELTDAFDRKFGSADSPTGLCYAPTALESVDFTSGRFLVYSKETGQVWHVAKAFSWALYWQALADAHPEAERVFVEQSARFANDISDAGKAAYERAERAFQDAVSAWKAEHGVDPYRWYEQNVLESAARPRRRLRI